MRSCFAVVAMFLVIGLSAQHTITGRVVDERDGAPLAYATVMLKGTRRGTITNPNGAFSINGTSPSDTLRISYVGYVTRLVPMKNLRTGERISLERTVEELAEFTVSVDERSYERVVRVARRLGRLPATTARVFFDMETHSDTLPVEVIHAFYNARYKAAGLEDLDLKQGRIGIAPKNGRYFINYNTTRAFAVLDILRPQTYFPTSPLEHLNSKKLKQDFTAVELSRGSGPDGVDHLLVSPRDGTAGAFTLELWLSTADDRVLALELHCTNCPKHPFLPLFDHGRIDTVDMRYRQTWSTTGPAVPEVMELNYRMAYSGPGFTESFRTHAVMHAFDRSSTFIPTLFTYPAELPDYRKIGWLPEDSLFWQRMAPPLPTERQQRDMEFLAAHDLRKGQWYEYLDNDRNFFGAHYALWSPHRRVWLNALTTHVPDTTTSLVKPGWLGDYAIAYETPKVVLVAQLYLDLDTVNGRFLHRSATVLDGFRTFDFLPEHPWTACFYNVWFDLCEMERRAMEERLNARGITVEKARAIHALHSDRLRATTEQYLRETRSGAVCEPLLEWSERVRKALGIDNIALLGI